MNPCVPSPCGPFSVCQDFGGYPSCSCSQNYVGSPPNCRPECRINSECRGNQACVKEKCIDPCPGSCGSNSDCHVVNHNPVCSCKKGYSGDPFTNCYLQPMCKFPSWFCLLHLKIGYLFFSCSLREFWFSIQVLGREKSEDILTF